MSIYTTLMDRIAESPWSDELEVTPDELSALLEWMNGPQPLLTPEPDMRVWRFRGRKLVVRP